MLLHHVKTGCGRLRRDRPNQENMLLKAIIFAVFAAAVSAETGLDGWLRYARVPNAAELADQLPSSIVVLNASEGSPVYTAATELRIGIQSIVGRSLDVSTDCKDVTSAIVVGTVQAYQALCEDATETPNEIEPDKM